MLKPKRNTLPPHAAEWLAQRTVEVGDCLIWTRCTNGDRHPVASFGGKSRARPVRRWLFEQMNGGPPPAGYKVLCTCADARCVKPGHLVAATPSELNDWINRAGRVNEATRRAACTRNARARSKLTIDIVRGMRASNPSKIRDAAMTEEIKARIDGRAVLE